jgi:ferric-dicitrate binding protein FerR (iron transport regulator)
MTGASRTPEDYQIEDFVTDESFINYFFGLNAEDSSFWTKWLIAHPRNAALAEEAKEMLRSLSLTLPETEFEAELNRMRTVVHADELPSARRRPSIFRLWQRGQTGIRQNAGDGVTNGDNQGETNGGRQIGKSGATNGAMQVDANGGMDRAMNGDARGTMKKRKRSFAAITLILLLLLAAAPFLWTRVGSDPHRLIVKSNESGKPIVFTLSDGTVVTLAPHGVFRYPADPGLTDRKAYLEGEARFQVSRDGMHPFQVYEGGIVATVLGTVFQVKEQAADSAILVELLSGRLKVETIAATGLSAQSILLAPDERVVYRRDSRKLYKEKWQSQHEGIATRVHLVFKKNNFDEIAAQMKAVFGITILNQSNKKNWSFTGNFNNAGVAEIVENICQVEGLQSETQGDTIVIK